MRRDIIKSINKIKKNNIDPHRLNISVSSNLNIAGWLGQLEPQDNINIYFIDIEKYLDDEYEDKEVIGKCICYYINGFDYVQEELIDIRNVADAMSGDLLIAVDPVVDSQGQLSEDYWGSNILYIDHFYIRPEYRGMGIGSISFPLILDTLGGNAGAITVIPCPTEDNGKDRIEQTDIRYSRVLNGMIGFYEKFGFKKVSDEVWAQNTQYKN